MNTKYKGKKMFKRIMKWKPEPSEASNALLAERRLGQKDVEHARGCDEQARSAKLDSGDVGACALRSNKTTKKQERG